METDATKLMGNPTPKLGDVVLYVLSHGPDAGSERPAIITRVLEGGAVQLYVFAAHPTELLHHPWDTTASYNEIELVPGSWRYA